MSGRNQIVIKEVLAGPVSGKAARRRRNRQRKKMRRASETGTFNRVSNTLKRGYNRQMRQLNASEALAMSRSESIEDSNNVLKFGNARSKGMAVSRRVATNTLAATQYAEVQGAIVAPQICPAERYSTEYASNPTAIASPWTIIDYPWSPADNPTNSQLGASAALVAVFRDPLRFIVYYDENNTEEPYVYTAYMTPKVGSSAVPVTPLPTDGALSFDEDIAAPYWQHYTPGGTFAPHGNYLYSGSDERTEKTYRWFDQGEQLTVTVNLGVSSTWGITVSLDQFKEDAVIQDSQKADASGSSNLIGLSMVVTSSGYYSVHVFYEYGAPVTTASINMYSTGAGSVFCHLPLPGFEANRQSVDGVRMVGVSAMYSNNAAPIQKAGTITGYQVPKETDWQQFIGPLSLVSKLNGAKTMPIENGIYGFLRLTEAEDVELIDEFAVDYASNALTASYYTLRNVKSYLILRGNVEPVDGRSGFLTLASSIEYMTTDVWRSLDVPRIDPAIYKAAISELKDVPQWHENPLHIKELFSKILSGATSVIKGVQKYAPQALTVAEILGSMLA
jgi:hypothetical protein